MWSGLTKYIRQAIVAQNKGIELPIFAIVFPIKNQNEIEAGKLTIKNIDKLCPSEVHMSVNQRFINESGGNIQVKESPYVSVFENA